MNVCIYCKRIQSPKNAAYPLFVTLTLYIMSTKFTCDCGSVTMATCVCDFEESGIVLTFAHLMELVTRNRTLLRHGLATEDYTPAGITEWVETVGSPDALSQLCQHAIRGSIACQEALLALDDMDAVVEELNRAMDDVVMEPVTDTMSNAAHALFEGCALPFSKPERNGYTYCKECASAECEHCICPVKTCGRTTCEHFFVLHNMNPALYRAWRNAPWPYRLLDGRCFCTTCNTTFECPDWDIDPHVSCCDGDCDTCPECIRKEIIAGRRY